MRAPSAVLFLVVVLLAGCQPEPRPIRYGEDACAHCRMTISDSRFGTELLTETGKTYLFDSVACLAGYVLAHPELREETHSLWVTSFHHPGELIRLDEAFFLRAPSVRSPMGMNLAAFGPETTREAARQAFGGEILTWNEVLALMKRQASEGAPHRPAASS